MPRYSKYMLRKWEAWVPLPPQPEGPKPTSPTSHESAPTTRLEATLGGGSSSTPALKLHLSAARNVRLRRLEGRVGSVGRERVSDAETSLPRPVTRQRAASGCLLAPLVLVIPGGLHTHGGLRHPASSSLPWL